jgi:uncharacterized protein
MLNFAAVPYQYWLVLSALLLSFGLAFAWVSRRRSGRMPARSARPRSLTGWIVYATRLLAFGLLALFVLIEGLIFYIDYQTVLSETAPAHHPVALPADLPFEVETVSFPSAPGARPVVRLAGWYAPPRSRAVIILLHGYGGDRAGMVWYARALVEAGYGVLMYDERASGESSGDYRSFGW